MQFWDDGMVGIEQLSRYDWKSIDEQLSKLSTLIVITLGFPTLDNLTFFSKTIEPCLHKLASCGLLKYAVWDSSNSCWVSCTATFQEKGSIIAAALTEI